MEFYIPTQIYHENGAVLKHGAELASLGRKALIITGKSSAIKTGALADAYPIWNRMNAESYKWDTMVCAE